MHQLVDRSPAHSRVDRRQTGLVITAIAVSTAAHSASAAAGPAGPMAWWMAAMAVLCLVCAAPMVAGQRCTSRAAEHLLFMGAAMILIHLAVFTWPGGGSHHGAMHGAGTSSGAGHGTAMLTLLGVELLCLMLASAALRMGSNPRTTSARLLPERHPLGPVN